MKEYQIPDIGQVKIYKRRNSRSIRMSLTHDGYVRVSLPYWTPYSAGLAFVKSKKNWITSNIPKQGTFIQDNQKIGKSYIVRFAPSTNTRFSSKFIRNLILINYPKELDIYDDKVQEYSTKIATKALKSECESYITPRITQLANQHGFKYKSVTYKKLKSRWGSCSSHRAITINIYLVQLPDELIDYVVLHELTHTKHMHHGSDFWDGLVQSVPRYKELKKDLKQYKPLLLNASIVA